MKFINLTPHEITIYKQDGTTITVPPSGKVFRLTEYDEYYGTIDGIELFIRTLALPHDWQDYFKDADEETLYLVSLPVVMTLRQMPIANLLHYARIAAPDTGSGAVRDEKGRIIGTKRLIIP
jgi:hypothetical protein